MQRLFDIIFSLLGIIVLSPVLLVIAVLVKLQDGGSVLYRARRVGLHGTVFSLVKFRTMIPNAHTLGAAITAFGDQRITPIGRVLRKFKLDELPQLINVLKGEMSFVGARPEDPKYVALYSADQKRVLEFRPGITSPASLIFRNEEELLAGSNWHERYVEEILPKKLEVDISYLHQRSIVGDVRIIGRTLRGIFT